VSIKSNFYYEGLAKENIERKQFIKPVRGQITDINGNLLAMNQIGFSISIKPHLKQDNPQLLEVIDILVDTFPDLNKSVMLKVYKKHNSPYNHKYIQVVDFIHYPEMMGAYPQLSILPELKIEIGFNTHMIESGNHTTPKKNKDKNNKFVFHSIITTKISTISV